MTGRKFSAGMGYRYGFNGKENDNEVKGEGAQQDYGMRIYDPRLGKFLSVDPLSADFAELTPYQFASNIPTKAVDIDGMEASWIPPGQTIRYDQIRSRPDATNQTATTQLRVQQQIEIRASNQRSQSAALSKPKSVLSATDTSPGANILREGHRQQSNFAKSVGRMMQTPEGQAGMGLALTMHGTAETPVRVADRTYGIYEGVQERNGWKIAGNTFGLALETAPFWIKGASGAAKELNALEKSISGAHFFSRHGAQTSLSSQYMRAVSGLTPDGAFLGEVNASRFLSHELQLKALNAAQSRFSITGEKSFQFDMGEVIGEGFLKGGGPRSFRTSSQVQAVFRENKLITLFPVLKK